MGNFIITVTDTHGNPFADALVKTTISANQTCGFLEIGCKSGPPVSSSQYTNTNGKVYIPMPYTVNQTVSIEVSARGYHTVFQKVNVEGVTATNWDVWGHKNIMLIPDSSPAPVSSGSYLGSDISSHIDRIGQDISNAGFIGSIELTIAVVFISIMIVVISVVYLAVRG